MNLLCVEFSVGATSSEDCIGWVTESLLETSVPVPMQGPSEMFQGISWFSEGGTKIAGGVRGVYLIPYTTRFHELQFLKKMKLIVFDILCPHILNIAWTIEQLNLIFLIFFGRGHKNSWGRRNYLGAMTQARHCVTLRRPLPAATAHTFVLINEYESHTRT